jgi:uncharacterized protein YceK
MKWICAALLAAVVTISSSGCGTVFNLTSNSPDNYGGVKHDLQFAADVSEKGGLLSGFEKDNPGASAKDLSEAGGVFALVALALYGTDLSLSFVADTLTLPLANYLRQRQEGSTDSAAALAK